MSRRGGRLVMSSQGSGERAGSAAIIGATALAVDDPHCREGYGMLFDLKERSRADFSPAGRLLEERALEDRSRRERSPLDAADARSEKSR